ncbi:hypothetical protein NPIL_449311 [Nephila pilipes]|uniref:Uncharacterized protein n=1 Tax=Nephila pilipes TaxID=299642 RepID=A0A8X6N3C9_NEPPI|nr:hypothetical protein NPIL_449311 [Nephila pilipes]
MNSTPDSTPANSPILNPQGESTCMARRRFAMEMEVLNIKILSQSNLLGNIQRYPQYEDTELYQIEKKRTQDPGKKKRQNGSYLAIIQFDNGFHGLLNVLEVLETIPGHYTLKQCNSIDEIHIESLA